jgi:putative drug exporter of the RND superfamily
MRWRRSRTDAAPPEEVVPVHAAGVFGALGKFIAAHPWIVIGVWIVLAVALPPLFPSLATVIQKQPASPLPADAPAMVANRDIAEAFPTAGSDNTVLVLMTDEAGLDSADEQTYRTLVGRLTRSNHDVVTVQEFAGTPELRETLSSADGKAWIMPVGIRGELGSIESNEAYARVAGIVRHTVADSGLTVHLTGPAATVADFVDVNLRDQVRIEAAIITFLLVILLVIYRNPVTMLLPLIAIGVSLNVAGAILAGASQIGLAVSSQTLVFLTGMLAGAGTDYAVFLISRYHDFLRHGAASDQALVSALSSIGKVIAASAATVGLTFVGMSFARLDLFATTGPALAIAIAVAFLAAVTLLPAIIVLAGRRRWIKPRRDLTTRFWRRSGVRIVRRPRTNLVVSLAVLLALAGCVGLVHYNYDDRRALPPDVDSSIGYAAMEQRFPLTSIIPQYLLIQSPHDLRTPEALADMEQMARRVSQLPDIAAVRGITRPTGEPLDAASTTAQAGEVGKRLSDASRLIEDRGDDLTKLNDGAAQLAEALASVRDQMAKSMSSVGSLLNMLTAIQKQLGALGGGATLGQIGDGERLVSGMRSLGDTLASVFGNVSTFDWVDPVVAALDGSEVCTNNPLCVTARDQFRAMAQARRDGTFDQLSGIARQLQSTGPLSKLSQTVRQLTSSLNSATRSLGPLGLGGGGGGVGGQGSITNLQQGFDRLAEGSRQVADGVDQLVRQTKSMGTDLGTASEFLLAMKNEATSPSMSGFYIPPQMLSSDDFKKAARFFISADGHSARYLVQTTLNPFSTAAMDQVEAIAATARGAQPNTVLSDATVRMTGYSATLSDARDYYDHDIRFIIGLTIVVVLAILMILLRAIVAPVYLIASVIVSYLAALGLGVVFFQLLLKQELHWSVPGLTFIILVAMGADYNMLLISRIRDESPRGIRSGVIRTVGSTGGVITAAGLIFAASMFGLLFASIGTIVQAGFVVGTGILLDTFLVRTVTVPAIAVLVGRANWWPSRWKPAPPTKTLPERTNP